MDERTYNIKYNTIYKREKEDVNTKKQKKNILGIKMKINKVHLFESYGWLYGSSVAQKEFF